MTVNLKETIAIKYPTPNHVTGELVFGNADAEFNHMWIGDETTGDHGEDEMQPHRSWLPHYEKQWDP